MLLILCSDPFLLNRWKKKYFTAREFIAIDSHAEERASNYFYGFTFVMVSVITCLACVEKGVFDQKYTRMVLFVLISMLSLHLGFSTRCIYLDGNDIVYKHIFRTKRITICPETKIVQKGDIFSIKNGHDSIRIDVRSFEGIWSLIYRVEMIRDSLGPVYK